MLDLDRSIGTTNARSAFPQASRGRPANHTEETDCSGWEACGVRLEDKGSLSGTLHSRQGGRLSGNGWIHPRLVPTVGVLSRFYPLIPFCCFVMFYGRLHVHKK